MNKFLYDATHHKPFCLGLTSVNEVCSSFFNTWRYNCYPVTMLTWYTVFEVFFFVTARFLMKLIVMIFHMSYSISGLVKK